MYRRVMIPAASLAALLTTTVSASASTAATFSSFWNWCWGGSGGGDTTSRVPEIDASTGLLALAAIGAALALSWEVKRLRSQKR